MAVHDLDGDPGDFPTGHDHLNGTGPVSTAVKPALKTPSSKPKFETVQILRAVAASLVVFHHFTLLISMRTSGSKIGNFAYFSEIGAGGVDIFFCISGFVITYAAAKLPGGVKSAQDFAFRRIWRIMPLYWFFTTVLAVGWMMGHLMRSLEMSPKHILYSYLLIPFPKPTSDGTRILFHPFLDSGWTLSFELYFYMVCALVILIAGGRRIFPLAPLIIGAIALVGAILGLSPAAAFILQSPLLVEFMCGVVIAELTIRGKLRHSSKQRLIGSILLVVGGVAFLLSTFSPYATDYRLFFWGLPGAMLLAGCVLHEGDLSHNWWNRLLVFLGTASFSIYLAHVIVLEACQNLAKRGLFNALNPDVAIILLTVGTIGLTSLSYFLAERPLMQLIERRRKPQAPAGNAVPVSV